MSTVEDRRLNAMCDWSYMRVPRCGMVAWLFEGEVGMMLSRALSMRSLTLCASLCLALPMPVALASHHSIMGHHLPSSGGSCPADVGEFPPPPSGFDPLSASPAELSEYGFPPRPSGDASDPAVEAWKQAMDAATTPDPDSSCVVGGNPKIGPLHHGTVRR